MTAKTEALRAPRQVSPWIVIGAAGALIAVLAVVTVSEPAVTPTREPGVVSISHAPTDAVEMAALKSAVAHEYMVERFGIPEIVSATVGTSSYLTWRVNANMAREYLRERLGTGEGSSSTSEIDTVTARLENGWVRTA